MSLSRESEGNVEKDKEWKAMKTYNFEELEKLEMQCRNLETKAAIKCFREASRFLRDDLPGIFLQDVRNKVFDHDNLSSVLSRPIVYNEVKDKIEIYINHRLFEDNRKWMLDEERKEIGKEADRIARDFSRLIGKDADVSILVNQGLLNHNDLMLMNPFDSIWRKIGTIPSFLKQSFFLSNTVIETRGSRAIQCLSQDYRDWAEKLEHSLNSREQDIPFVGMFLLTTENAIEAIKMTLGHIDVGYDPTFHVMSNSMREYRERLE